MKHFIMLLSILLFFPTLSAMAFDSDTTEPAPALAPSIEIQNPYAFATMPGATTGAAFMVIKNTGDLDDKLIGATSKVAEITEIHQNMIDPDDGTMMMRKVKEISIPMEGQAILEPKGYHVMFIKMKEALVMNESVDITLIFEKSGEIQTPVSIVAPGTKPKQEKKMPWDTTDSTTAATDDATAEQPETIEERTTY